MHGSGYLHQSPVNTFAFSFLFFSFVGTVRRRSLSGSFVLHKDDIRPWSGGHCICMRDDRSSIDVGGMSTSPGHPAIRERLPAPRAPLPPPTGLTWPRLYVSRPTPRCRASWPPPNSKKKKKDPGRDHIGITDATNWATS